MIREFREAARCFDGQPDVRVVVVSGALGRGRPTD